MEISKSKHLFHEIQQLTEIFTKQIKIKIK